MPDFSWTFWIIAGGLVILSVLPLAIAFLRGRDAAGKSAADYDLEVYRDQLRELDRDLEKGTIPEAEAARIRTEISRRVLEADRQRQSARGALSGAGPVAMGTALVILVTLGAIWLYLDIGQPGRGDLPRAERIAAIEEARAARPSQAAFEREVAGQADPEATPGLGAGLPDAAEADPERMEAVNELRRRLEQDPSDLRGWEILAVEEARLGNFRAARLAQGRVVAGREQPAPSELVLLAEFMIGAADGYVSPEAETALLAALAQQPTHPWGRYYAGLMYAQQGRPDLAYPIWRNLLADSAPGSPWLSAIRQQIEQVSFLAGDPVSLSELPQPRDPVGPSAAEIMSAQGMSPEDRAAMIGGMVGRLAERLATEGGTPEDWARLVGSYTVLGEAESAAAVLEEARVVFADAPEALAMIEAAAEGNLPRDPMGRPEPALPDIGEPE